MICKLEFVNEWLFEQKERMIDLQRRLTACPALGPDNGGQGEWQKAEILKEWLFENGFPDVDNYNVEDERVKSGLRPNFCIRYSGKDNSKTCWIISHLDVVPAGDRCLWDSDPWAIRVEGNKIYGRGTEDNQQAIVSSIFALDYFIKNRLEPHYDIALLFVADEETASSYGLEYLVEHQNLFKSDDLIVIPDAGNEEGTLIQIAEKSILWLRFTTIGKQTHASRPSDGINAMLAGSRLVVELDSMFDRYKQQNSLFDPPTSTFQPTLRESNVPNVNTIPGRDVFCIDCRILPEENIEEIMKSIRDQCTIIEKKYNVKISIDIVQQTIAAPPTSPESPIVKALTDAIQEVYNVHPSPMGVGGGTVANFLRLKSIPAAVWSRHDKTAHQPNEYCLISNLIGDASVFIKLFL